MSSSKNLIQRTDTTDVAALRRQVAALEKRVARLGNRPGASHVDLTSRMLAEGDTLGLSRALWAASGLGRESSLKCASFDIRNAVSQPRTNQRQTWVALQWPGGVMSGFAWLQTTTGGYTNVGSAYWLYESDGTTLTPIPDAGATDNLLFKDSPGIAGRLFESASFPQPMDAGIYYMMILGSWAASPGTVPEIGCLVPPDPAVWTGAGDLALPNGLYPAGWQPVYNDAGVSSLGGTPPANTTISTVDNTTNTALPWLALY